MSTTAAINSATNDSNLQGPRYRSAFTRLTAAIRALSPEEYEPVNLDVMSIVRTTEGVLPKIVHFKDVIVQALPQFQIELFEQLEDRALALGHAHTVYQGTLQPPPIPLALSDEATSLHDIALSEANTLVKRGLLPAHTMNALKGGNGYRNLAADLFTLAESMHSNWAQISARTSMTIEELDRMQNLADQINQALGVREQMPELQVASAKDRQAAYTLFLKAYNEVRAAIAYVRRKEDDVDTLMPSLFAGRSGGKRKPPVEEPPEPPQPPATPVIEIPSATAAAPTEITPIRIAPPKNAATILDDNGPFMQ